MPRGKSRDRLVRIIVYIVSSAIRLPIGRETHFKTRVPAA